MTTETHFLMNLGEYENMDRKIRAEILEVVQNLSKGQELSIEEEVDIERLFSQRPELKQRVVNQFVNDIASAGVNDMDQFVDFCNGRLLFVQSFCDQKSVNRLEGSLCSKMVQYAKNLEEMIGIADRIPWQTWGKETVVARYMYVRANSQKDSSYQTIFDDSKSDLNTELINQALLDILKEKIGKTNTITTKFSAYKNFLSIKGKYNLSESMIEEAISTLVDGLKDRRINPEMRAQIKLLKDEFGVDLNERLNFEDK